jgi:integrase
VRLTPSFEEFQAIAADIRARPFNGDAHDSANFVEFIGLAGLGQAEAANLRRQDVNLKAGMMSVRRSKTSTAFAVPIYPQLRPLMERLCQGLIPRDRVFQIKDAKKAIAGACRRLELPRYSHRSLRRMFITRAIERGVDVKVIADWQGHRDGGKLILDTYSHVRPVHSQRMAQLMTNEEPENLVQMPATKAQNG